MKRHRIIFESRIGSGFFFISVFIPTNKTVTCMLMIIHIQNVDMHYLTCIPGQVNWCENVQEHFYQF